MQNFNSIYKKLTFKKFYLKLIIILFTFGFISPVISQSQYLLVSSRNGDVVQRFNGETGEYIDDFVTFRSGRLSAPQEILLINGKLLITGRFNQSILSYDGVTGEFIGNFSSGYLLDGPTKMTLGPDSLLYISQWGPTKTKVVRFRSDDGTFVDEFTNIDLTQGMGHAWDSFGNVFIADFGTSEIKKFNSSGEFQENFIESNSLSGPINIWFGNNDSSLFISNWNTNSILKFNGITGDFESTFIAQGLGNAEGITFGPDGNIYLCDRTGNRVIRYNPDGIFIDVFTQGGSLNTPNSLIFIENTTTDVSNDKKQNDRSFQLQNNYPNPFNPSTNISFILSQKEFVTLKVFDMLGEKVATLIEDEKREGKHNIIFDGSNLASGIYYYQLITGSLSKTRKMILNK